MMESFELAMKRLLRARERVIEDTMKAVEMGHLRVFNLSFTTYASIDALIAQTIEDAAFALMHPEEEE